MNFLFLQMHFNSIIVRLKPLTYDDASYKLFVFQFYNSTIKTFERYNIQLSVLLFQFYNSTIKT